MHKRAQNYVGSVLLIFLSLCVVLLCVFAFWISWCDVVYDFSIQMIFCTYLPPVVCNWVLSTGMICIHKVPFTWCTTVASLALCPSGIAVCLINRKKTRIYGVGIRRLDSILIIKCEVWKNMRENRNHQHIFNIQLLSYDLYVILIQRHDSLQLMWSPQLISHLY
jgi:hypothetical protein